MSNLPNRLTTTFALMIPGRGRRSPRPPRQTVALAIAIAPPRRSHSKAGIPWALPPYTITANQLSLDSALAWPHPSLQMPLQQKKRLSTPSIAIDLTGVWQGLGRLFKRSLSWPKHPLSIRPVSFHAGVNSRSERERLATTHHQTIKIQPISRSSAYDIASPRSRQSSNVYNWKESIVNKRQTSSFLHQQIEKTAVSQPSSVVPLQSVTRISVSGANAIPPNHFSPSVFSQQVLAPTRPETQALFPPAAIAPASQPVVTPFLGSQSPTPSYVQDRFNPAVGRTSHTSSTVVQEILQLRTLTIGPQTTPTPPKASVPEPIAPITIQGGIHVQVTAPTLDPAHAEATARTLADQMLKELNRITERDRFRRGLPTYPLR